MNTPTTGLKVAGAIFGLMACAHIARLGLHVDIVIAGTPLPMWPSVMAGAVLGGLAVWLWRLSAD